MKVLCFKFHKNRTINEEFFFLRGRGGGPLFINSYLISIIIGEHLKMLCLKFKQNFTINEEFDYFEGSAGRERPPGGKGAPIHKFLSQFLLVII